jgi:hypothetical protein
VHICKEKKGNGYIIISVIAVTVAEVTAVTVTEVTAVTVAAAAAR